MATRLLAGILGLAILLPAIIFGGELAVEIIVPLVIGVCIAEYSAMAFPDDRYAAFGWLAPGTAILYGTLLYTDVFAVALVLVMVGTQLWVTLRPGESLERAADNTGRYLVGMVWVGVLLASVVVLRRLEYGLAWVFLVLTISWLADTGAYFAGRTFGKTKLYERVSPKKTWEGVVGGMITAIIGVFVVRAVGLPTLTPLDCVVLGGALSLASVAGDLAESLMKRAFGVKDSGWIMPGHGGLLDRIDSVLFVAPLLLGYVTLVKGIG